MDFLLKLHLQDFKYIYLLPRLTRWLIESVLKIANVFPFTFGNHKPRDFIIVLEKNIQILILQKPQQKIRCWVFNKIFQTVLAQPCLSLSDLFLQIKVLLILGLKFIEFVKPNLKNKQLKPVFENKITF